LRWGLSKEHFASLVNLKISEPYAKLPGLNTGDWNEIAWSLGQTVDVRQDEKKSWLGNSLGSARLISGSAWLGSLENISELSQIFCSVH